MPRFNSNGWADPMSSIERLLIPGSTELPGCHCGGEMRIATHDPLPEKGDAQIRIYKCPSCSREMRLRQSAALRQSEL
jgi:hypothetical protein